MPPRRILRHTKGVSQLQSDLRQTPSPLNTDQTARLKGLRFSAKWPSRLSRNITRGKPAAVESHKLPVPPRWRTAARLEAKAKPAVAGPGSKCPPRRGGERARQSDRDNTPAPAPVTTNGESGQEQKERALLACPFWKNNPLRHRACYRGFKRIRDVKYHLKRNHVRPRCPRCGTQFDQVGAVSTHLRNPQEVCARRDDLDDIPYDSISPEQAMTLSQYSDRTYSQEQQWFAIWDIVFHGHPQPMSAYVDTDMSADLSSYHTFSSTHGVYFISERLHDHGYTTVPRDLVQDVLRESQDLIYNSWVQEWQRGSPSSTQSAESSSGTPQSTSTGDPSVSGVNGFPATPVQLDDDNNWYTPTSFDFFAHDPDNMGG